MTTPFERRTRRCQQRLSDLGATGLILFPGPNMYYLSGVAEDPSERLFLLIVPAVGDPVFLVPALSAAQVTEATWIADVRSWADEDDPAGLLDEVVTEVGLSKRILVDDHLWAVVYQELQSALPAASFGLASEVLDDLRVRKDDQEIVALREAAKVADAVSTEIRSLGTDVVGWTEEYLAREIEERIRVHGASGPSFETIVGSGPNGAKPHHTHGDREIESGDPVVLDFGCELEHYVSDQTRTMVFGGDPPNEFEEAFDAVLAALHAGVDAVEPGVPAAAVDRATRQVIEDAGYGEAFIHRTGHGVGLGVHEPPYIVEGNDHALEPGMAFSVEPGVYFEGRFGVRIEDIVVVTEDGAERLNDSPRQWRPSV